MDSRTRSSLHRFWLRPTLALFVGLLAAGFGTAEGQTREDRVRAVLDTDSRRQIQTIVREARDAGVPAWPIYDKVLEGVAKRVPAERILPAVEAYAGRLHTAHGAFAGAAGPAWVIAGADAIGRGVQPEALAALRESYQAVPDGVVWQPRRGPASVVVLGDLVERGIPSERALRVLEAAFRSGQNEADIVAIPRIVNQLVREGATPGDAAQRMVRDMGRGARVRGMVRRRPGNVFRPPVFPGVEPESGRRPDARPRGG